MLRSNPLNTFKSMQWPSRDFFNVTYLSSLDALNEKGHVSIFHVPSIRSLTLKFFLKENSLKSKLDILTLSTKSEKLEDLSAKLGIILFKAFHQDLKLKMLEQNVNFSNQHLQTGKNLLTFTLMFSSADKINKTLLELMDRKATPTLQLKHNTITKATLVGRFCMKDCPLYAAFLGLSSKNFPLHSLFCEVSLNIKVSVRNDISYNQVPYIANCNSFIDTNTKQKK